MPTVGLYGAPKVATAALPGARLTQAQTPESEGAGLAEAKAQSAEALANLGGAVAHIGLDLHARAQQQADDVAELAWENKLHAGVTQILYDPDKGALGVKGEAAMGLPEQTAEAYRKLSGGIAQTLSNPKQQLAFARTSAQYEQNLDLTVRRHVSEQIQSYEQTELTDFVKNQRDAAISNALDPRMVFDAVGKGTQALTRSAGRMGLGPEALKQTIDSFTTSTHAGVIDSLLAQGKNAAAKVYFEETKDQIHGDATEKIERAITEGALRGQAQQKSDEILGAGGTLAEQRAKVKAIDDPDLRDAVDQRIEHEAAVSASAARANEEQMLSTAYATVGRTGNVNSISPTDWAALGTHQPGLIEYATKLTKGEPIETDSAKYYALMQQASEAPEEFVKTNLLTYRGSLDNATFKQLTDLQYSIRKGDRENADKVLGGFRTNVQLVDDSLTSYGIDPASKDPSTKSAIAELRRMLDTRVQAQTSLTGKKPTNDDIQTTLDSILSQTRTTPGSWWGLIPFNGISLSATSKRLIDLTPADVPAADRTQIEDSLRRAGLPVSDTTVLDVYLNHLAGRKQ